MFFIGTGLIYGARGYDFENILHDIFAVKPPRIPTTQENENNIIPMANIADFPGFISQIIQEKNPKIEKYQKNDTNENIEKNDTNEVIGKNGKNGKTRSVSFIPFTDYVGKTIRDVVSTLSRNITGSAVSPKFTLLDDLENKILGVGDGDDDDDDANVWNIDLPFSPPVLDEESSGIVPQAQMGTLENNHDVVWKEFTSLNSLLACRIVVCGGPKSGKTELSKHISSA